MTSDPREQRAREVAEQRSLDVARAEAAALETRHKSGAKAHDYLKAFLPIARRLAYATRDDSWGEFEKEFSIIICRLVDAERALLAERREAVEECVGALVELQRRWNTLGPEGCQALQAGRDAILSLSPPPAK